jgi:excisionase family DNA binding protein
MRLHVVGLRRRCCPSLEVARTHDGHLSTWPHTAERVPEAEGFGSFVPALRVTPGVRTTARLARTRGRMRGCGRRRRGVQVGQTFSFHRYATGTRPSGAVRGTAACVDGDSACYGERGTMHHSRARLMAVDPLPAPAIPHLLEVAHVAHRLGFGQEYVRRLIRDRKLTAIRLGNRWRVSESDLKAFIDQQTQLSQRNGNGHP